MNTIKSMVLVAVGLMAVVARAQTPDEVVNGYLNQTGGKDKLSALKSLRMEGKIKMQSVEIPVTIFQEKGGKLKIATIVNGVEFVQTAYDGKTAWATNAVTKLPEILSEEDTYNIQQEADADFPNPFLDYKSKGYVVETQGREKVGNVDCIKLKLTKKGLKRNKKVEENSMVYYFDAQDFSLLMSRGLINNGPVRGIPQEIMYNNFQKVDGMTFPFEMRYRISGQEGQTIIIEKIAINPVLDNKVFVFPEGK
ncbi:hypothetical protein DR864_04925 [Runella rosea]|uniref:Outer membrane lipoprotein-sorting protein n=1 Tax=Runella rosea TaxID=2259595 RepID=A0A344TEQ1_9BACT|nr:hypothetical protein [Runella rosea]AXE17122.1 hypothetical protein DR864_04925 [Runella rosea]